MEIEAGAMLVVLALVSPAVVLLVVRGHSPWPAFFTGALTTAGTTVLVGLVVIVVAWVLASESFPDCETCDILEVGFATIGVLLLLIAAIPMAFIGGFVSALASLALVQPKDSAQP